MKKYAVLFLMLVLIGFGVKATDIKEYLPQELNKEEGLVYDNYGDPITGNVIFQTMGGKVVLNYKDGKIGDSFIAYGLNKKVSHSVQIKDGIAVSGSKRSKDDKRDITLTTDELQKASEEIKWFSEQGIDLFSKIGQATPLANTERKAPKPLYLAADVGDLQKVRELVEAGEDVNYVCNEGCAGWTPVMIAAANNHPEVVKYLLEKGANPNAQNSRGRSALHFAVIYNFTDIVQMLLEAKANPNIQSNEPLVAPNTPVKAAMSNENIDILVLLLNAGGDKNAEYKGMTPLKLAEKYNDVALKQILSK